ncbi:MAG: YceH family protein [Burkholderiaceae bacterium]
MTIRSLTEPEARVLGTLMEKARTVPDSYPLTLNAVVTGCNQKTSREPVMSLTDGQAQEAIDSLKALHLVFETSGGRAVRYEHNFQRVIGVPEQSAVLLGLLMLRGPQTAGELRINSERWYRFADISSVEGFLDELQERGEEKGGPLVARLARLPSAREQRWAHLLCGAVSAQPADEATKASADTRNLSFRVAELESEVALLRGAVEKISAELGIGLSQPGHE